MALIRRDLIFIFVSATLYTQTLAAIGFGVNDLKNYNPNGKIEVEGEYINDLEEGKWIFRDSLGNVTHFVYYKGGQIERELNQLQKDR